MINIDYVPSIETLQDSGVSGVTAYTATDLLLNHANGIMTSPWVLSLLAAFIPFLIQWLREYKRYYWDVKRKKAGLDHNNEPIDPPNES